MKQLLFLLLSFVVLAILGACTATKENVEEMATGLAKKVPALPDLGAAPEILNDTWLNSDTPLRLADLRGKVVLVEFWTFACINCQRVIPYMNEWHEKYAGDDFIIISIHYPEFRYEREIENVRQALTRFEIKFPVAIDNDRLTWSAYNQRFWPTRYLIDKNGQLRYKHIGEGAYEETAAAIEALMAESDPVAFYRR